MKNTNKRINVLFLKNLVTDSEDADRQIVTSDTTDFTEKVLQDALRSCVAENTTITLYVPDDQVLKPKVLRACKKLKLEFNTTFTDTVLNVRSVNARKDPHFSELSDYTMKDQCEVSVWVTFESNEKYLSKVLTTNFMKVFVSPEVKKKKTTKPVEEKVETPISEAVPA